MVSKQGADGNPGTEMQAFLQGLKHSRKAAVEAVRVIISAHSGITEQIKWKAPSFGINGDDCITFRLQPGDRVQLVFHRGAQKRDDATRFSFKDSSGLLECVTLVRALVTFGDLDDVEAKSAALKDLMRRWMIATSGGG
jgi:hypothetical protein